MRVEFCELVDVISVTSAIVPRWRSSGVATLVAMTSGLAPGIDGIDRDRREVDLRQRRNRQQAEGNMIPASAMPTVSSVVATGRCDEDSGGRQTRLSRRP